MSTARQLASIATAEGVERDMAPILDPRDPLPSASVFIEREHMKQGRRTLHHHHGEWFRWNGTAYRSADEAAIRADLYQMLARAVVAKEGNKTEPFRPNRNKVGDVLDALRAAANLPASIVPPAWLDREPAIDAPTSECAVVDNGILHLPTLNIYPPTPEFFTTTALPVAYEPDASEPFAWLDFLASLWPDDGEAIDALQELFGYLLTADTRQQKAFLIVGPKRSGKGTLARVLTAMLGPDNVTAPTLAGLASNFGLAPLIGKQLAIIADARLGGRADQQAIAERLLSISGEDAVTIDRKYLPAWTGRLPTRFLILTNELPRLADASGALASRFIVLTLRNSFYGREDHGLTDRLLGELPAILRWSVEGWHRLRSRGYFRQPESSREAIEELETLGSPITAFISERCAVGPGYEIGTKSLYHAWRTWCEDHGRQPGTEQTFGRDLRAALPGLGTRQPRDESGRVRLYVGIDLQ